MNVSSRKIKGVHYSVVMFWHGAVGMIVPTLIAIVIALIGGQPFYTYDGWGYFWLFLGASADVMACAGGLIAFQSDESSFVSLLAYIQLVWVFLVDFFLFKVDISILKLLCTLCIFATVFSIGVYKYRLSLNK